MPSNPRTVVELLAGWSLAGLFLFALLETWEPSANPDIYIFSYRRALVAAALVLGALYFLVGSAVARVRRFNAELVLIVLLAGAVHEGLIRIGVTALPQGIAAYLPPPARQRYVDANGEFPSLEGIQGTGMLYHMVPGSRSEDQPWLTADGDGYRNPQVPDSDLDAVFLGGSIVLAAYLERDLAAIYRDRGWKTHSFAMGSYSVYQSTEALRRFVYDRGLKARRVFIKVWLDSDLSKALSYRLYAAASGDWRDYLIGERPALDLGLPATWTPWSLYLFNQLPYNLAQRQRNAAVPQQAPVPVRQGERTEYLRRSLFSGRERMNEAAWQYFSEGLSELLRVAASHGSEVIVAHLPPVAIQLQSVVLERDPAMERVIALHDRERDRLAAIVAAGGGRYIDLTDVLQSYNRSNPPVTEIHMPKRPYQHVADYLWQELN